jgi:hypothetical protein
LSSPLKLLLKWRLACKRLFWLWFRCDLTQFCFPFQKVASQEQKSEEGEVTFMAFKIFSSEYWIQKRGMAQLNRHQLFCWRVVETYQFCI